MGHREGRGKGISGILQDILFLFLLIFYIPVQTLSEYVKTVLSLFIEHLLNVLDEQLWAAEQHMLRNSNICCDECFLVALTTWGRSTRAETLTLMRKRRGHLRGGNSQDGPKNLLYYTAKCERGAQ